MANQPLNDNGVTIYARKHRKWKPNPKIVKDIRKALNKRLRRGTKEQ